MARQRYYGEKFKPTKGAFGGTSKFNRKLKLQAELREQLKKMEVEQTQKANQADKVEPDPKKEAAQPKNVTDRTE